MSKETFILMMAHSGLSVAASLLAAAAADIERQAGLAKDDLPTAQHLRELAARKRHLAKMLAAADAGITDYLARN